MSYQYKSRNPPKNGKKWKILARKQRHIQKQNQKRKYYLHHVKYYFHTLLLLKNLFPSLFSVSH